MEQITVTGCYKDGVEIKFGPYTTIQLDEDDLIDIMLLDGDGFYGSPFYLSDGNFLFVHEQVKISIPWKILYPILIAEIGECKPPDE